MKILVNASNYSEKFISLTNALQGNSTLQVGFTNGKINSETISQFNPDILIHNSLENIQQFSSNKLIQLFLHEGVSTDFSNSFDINNLEPFIDRNLVKNPIREKRYECDIGLIGNPTFFNGEIIKYTNLAHKVKMFGGTPINIYCYTGAIPRINHSKVYASAKVSPYSVLEVKSRYYEIICSDGNPVIYKPGAADRFHEGMSRGLSGKRIKPEITKEEILKTHTNFNALKVVLNNVGLKRLAKSIGE